MLSRRRWNRTTEYISSPTDLKSALHTSEDHPRMFVIHVIINSTKLYIYCIIYYLIQHLIIIIIIIINIIKKIIKKKRWLSLL